MAKEESSYHQSKKIRQVVHMLMTQQELTDRIGMRRETIHLGNNRYNPSLEMALKIAQVFNLKESRRPL